MSDIYMPPGLWVNARGGSVETMLYGLGYFDIYTG